MSHRHNRMSESLQTFYAFGFFFGFQFDSVSIFPVCGSKKMKSIGSPDWVTLGGYEICFVIFKEFSSGFRIVRYVHLLLRYLLQTICYTNCFCCRNRIQPGPNCFEPALVTNKIWFLYDSMYQKSSEIDPKNSIIGLMEYALLLILMKEMRCAAVRHWCESFEREWWNVIRTDGRPFGRPAQMDRDCLCQLKCASSVQHNTINRKRSVHWMDGMCTDYLPIQLNVSFHYTISLYDIRSGCTSSSGWFRRILNKY